jgi:hypothetical protein
MNPVEVKTTDAKKVRNISFADFKDSLKRIRASVSSTSLKSFASWNSTFGDVSL